MATVQRTVAVVQDALGVEATVALTFDDVTGNVSQVSVQVNAGSLFLSLTSTHTLSQTFLPSPTLQVIDVPPGQQPLWKSRVQDGTWGYTISWSN